MPRIRRTSTQIARLLAVRLGRSDRAVTPIRKRQTMKLAGDEIDDLTRAVVQLFHQRSTRFMKT